MCTRKHKLLFTRLCFCLRWLQHPRLSFTASNPNCPRWTGNGDPLTHPHIFTCIVFTGRDLHYQAGIFPRSEIRASDNPSVCYTQTFQHRTTGADCSYITVIPPYLRVNNSQVQPNTETPRYRTLDFRGARPPFASSCGWDARHRGSTPSSLPPVQVFVIHDRSLWRWLPCWRSADSHKLAHRFYCHLSLNALQIDFFFLLFSLCRASSVPEMTPLECDTPRVSALAFALLDLCLMSFECVRLTCFQ